MNILKPTTFPQFFIRDKLKTSQTLDSAQQDKLKLQRQSKPHIQRCNNSYNGPLFSRKTSDNRQNSSSQIHQPAFNQYFNSYLQKCMKINLDKISKIRNDHETEKQSLFRQINSLKNQIIALKQKYEGQATHCERNVLQNLKEVSSLQQKNLSNKFYNQRIKSLNPQKFSGRQSLRDNLKQKAEKLEREVEEYKNKNFLISLQVNNLKINIQKLQKQFQVKQTSFIQMEQNLKNELKGNKLIIQNLKKQNQSQRRDAQIMKKEHQSLKKQNYIIKIQSQINKKSIQSVKRQSQIERVEMFKIIDKLKLQIQEIEEKTNKPIKHEQNYFQTLNNALADKRVVKHLQNRLQQKQYQILQKNVLIDELNSKIMSNKLVSLNNKCKYLTKL